MIRSHFNQNYVNSGYPQTMPDFYWERYPQETYYYHQPMYPYPFQMAGDNVKESGGQPTPYFQPFTEQMMTIGVFPGATMQPYSVQPQVSPSINPFDNPLQPQVKRPPQQQYTNPYPQQQFMQKAQPSGFQSVLNQFKTNDGSVDVTKMMNTAGQMVNTVSQMTNVFKGVGSLFKTKV